MNKIVNKCLLDGDKFMPKLHLRQPGFTHSACGSFTKYRETIQKFREISNLKYIYKNELDKTCFAYDLAYFDSNHLAKRAISDKIVGKRAYEIAINPKYNRYQRGLASVIYNFFDEKKGSGELQ